MRGTLAVLGLLLMTSPAAAAPLADPAPWVLPVNAFAKAKPGDWTILEGDAVLGGKQVHEREIVRVGEVKAGVADVQLFEGAAGKESWFLSFPVDVKRGPDTNLLFDLPWVATDLTQEKATCTLGDASFPCTKVAYRTGTHRVTALLAARVKGSGLVSFDVVGLDGKPLWSMKTIGYGSAAKVEWGAGPPRADLEANWDGGAKDAPLREGSAPAADDVWQEELPPLAFPPRADLTTCTVHGDRKRGDVQRLLQRKLVGIEDCYAALVGKRKAAAGAETVEIAFDIDELAAVTELKATGTAVTPVRACVVDAVTPIQFAFTETAGITSVACTFTFDPGKPAPPHKRPLKRTLVTRKHPARGGPDLRGVVRIP